MNKINSCKAIKVPKLKLETLTEEQRLLANRLRSFTTSFFERVIACGPDGPNPADLESLKAFSDEWRNVATQAGSDYEEVCQAILRELRQDKL